MGRGREDWESEERSGPSIAYASTASPPCSGVLLQGGQSVRVKDQCLLPSVDWSPGMVAAMSETVLVVDDNAAVRDLLVELLATQRLTVVTASSGEEGLEAFARHKPDLVLLDVVMPGMNGFEVCRRLKSDAESRLVPVVLVTGLTAVDDRVQGIEAGADDFLSKPVDRSELFARVRSLLSVKVYTDELERAESVLFALARSIEAKDPYTEGHCERLSDYSACPGGESGTAGGPDNRTATRRNRSRHRQGGGTRPHPVEAGPAHGRGMGDHEGSPGGRRAHLRAPEIIPAGVARDPPSP